MEKNENSSAPIVVVGFVIIFILLGIVFFIYLRGGRKQLPEVVVGDKGSYHTLDVENKTPFMYTVVLPNKEHIDIKPEDKVKFSIALGDTIRATAYNFDNTIINYYSKIDDKRITNLYIGKSGIYSNLSSGNISFVNASKYPIMFIEKSSKGGKRWGSDIILPGKETVGNFVHSGGIWQIVHPTDERNPISQLNIGTIPKKLVFDGKNLKAI